MDSTRRPFGTGLVAHMASRVLRRYNRRRQEGTGSKKRKLTKSVGRNVKPRRLFPGVGTRKRKGGSRTVTNTKQRTETATNSAEFSALYKTYGKELSLQNKVNKLVLNNRNYLTQGYTACSNWGGVSGFMKMNNVVNGGNQYVPLALIELGSTQQLIGGSLTAPSVYYQPYFVTTNLGVTQWSATHTLTTYSQGNGSTYPNRSSHLDWVSMDFMCYCPTASSTRWSFDIVQFKDQRLVPQASLNTTADSNFTAEFYQSLMKKYMYSPLMTLDPTWKKYMTILKSTHFYMDPKSSTDSVNTITKRLKIFWKANRKMNWSWDPAGTQIINQGGVTALNDNSQQVNSGVTQCYTHPKARVFMLVRCQAQLGTGTAYDSTVHPSFDYVLKHKQMLLE